MAFDKPRRVDATLPLGVRLFAYLLVMFGLLGLLFAVVVAVGAGAAAGLLIPVVLGGLAIGTAASGAGLNLGYSWPVTLLKVLLGAAVAAAIVFAIVPGVVYVLIATEVYGLPLAAPIHYLEQHRVRSALRPLRSEAYGMCAPFRRTAPAWRSIGGLGLFVWGLLITALFAVALVQAMGSGDALVELEAAGLLEFYAAPCLLFGVVIWRVSPGPPVVFIGYMLSLVTCIALNATGLLVLVPGAMSAALGLGLLAPSGPRRDYSAFASK